MGQIQMVEKITVTEEFYLLGHNATVLKKNSMSIFRIK
jgi:hypothetical protein